MEFDKNLLLKSVMNYSGGKYKLLPQLLPLFPQKVDTFVDLFCGGLDISLNVRANKVVSNDTISPIINMYKSMQEVGYKNTLKHIENRIHEFELNKVNKEGYIKFRNYYNINKNKLDLFVLVCYSFCSYNKKDKVSKSDEVYIKNY